VPQAEVQLRPSRLGTGRAGEDPGELGRDRHATAGGSALPSSAEAVDDPAVLKAHIRELSKQLARSEMEKDILKKAKAYFAKESL
jgi:transposase-like protein